MKATKAVAGIMLWPLVMLRSCCVELPHLVVTHWFCLVATCNIRNTKMAGLAPAKFKFLFYFQIGGGGRTRTYEGIASGFTVRPLCRSGHSPEAVAPY